MEAKLMKICLDKSLQYKFPFFCCEIISHFTFLTVQFLRTIIIPFFAFPAEIRKVIYTTNVIESVNRQIRKIIKNKGVFPDDKSIQKIIFLALRNAAKKWTMPLKDWPLALNQFEILCGDFKYDLLKYKK